MSNYKSVQLLEVREKIEYFANEIETLSSLPDFENLRVKELVNELQFFVRNSLLDSIYEELKDDVGVISSVGIIRNFYSKYVLYQEIKVYLSNFQTELFDSNPYLIRASGFAKLEGEALGLDSNSKILFAGSGPLPETALTCIKLFRCKVVCLDNDLETVFLTRKLIDKLKLNNLLEIQFGNAESFDYKGFSHVILAVMASPKNEILKRICETSDKNVMISCRTVKGLKSLLYEPAADLRLGHYTIVGYVEGGVENIVHSIVLAHKTHEIFEYFAMDKLDSQKVRSYCLSLIEKEYGLSYTPVYHTDLDLLGTIDDYYVPEKSGFFVVANKSDKIVGCGGLRNLITKEAIAKKFSQRYSNKKVGSIWRVYTDYKFRNLGVGTKIVNLLEKEARNYGYGLLYLHSSRKNPAAIDFWIKRGYSVFLEEDNEDKTVHMEKILS